MTPTARVLKALVNLAVARQAPDFGESAQRVYLHLLADLEASTVARACERLAREPRQDYGATMPSVGDIRDAAETVARDDARASAQRALAPHPVSDDDGPRYFCLSCRDETSAWRPFWCQGRGQSRSFDRPAWSVGSMVECGQTRDHGPHAYVARCECYATNPISAKRRQREAMSRVQASAPRRRGAA